MIDTLNMILSIIGSSAITAAILSYYFNKKLKQHEMYLNLNHRFFSSLIDGLHLLMNDYKSFVLKAEEIKQKVENGVVNDRFILELKQLKQQYHDTLRGHRVYLTPLVKYGGTSVNDVKYDDINLVAAKYLIEFLEQMQTTTSKEFFEVYKNACIRSVFYINASYESVCHKSNTIIEHLQQGKNPFMIRWKYLHNDTWEDIAEQMHDELLPIEMYEELSD